MMFDMESFLLGFTTCFLLLLFIGATQGKDK